MARLKGFKYGKILTTLAAMKVYQVGDEVVVKKMPTRWYDKMKLDPPNLDIRKVLLITDVSWDDASSQIEVGGTPVHTDEIAAWRRPIVSSTKKE